MPLKLPMFPMEETHGFVMRLAAAKMKSGLNRAFQAAGLERTAEQWSVLATLKHHDGIAQTEVARNVTKDRQTMTRILDLLEAGGLVERRPHPNDRRCNLVYITAKGEQELERCTEAGMAFTMGAFRGLSQRELDELIRVNRIVVNNIKGLDFDKLFSTDGLGE